MAGLDVAMTKLVEALNIDNYEERVSVSGVGTSFMLGGPFSYS